MTDDAALATENERLKAELERMQKRGDGWAKTRRVLTPIVIVLACLSLLAATIGVWVNRTVWNEEKYIERVVPLIEEPAVVEALATQLTDQTMEALDVETRVQDAIVQLAQNLDVPEQLAFLAGPLTQSIRDLVHDQAVKFLQSDTFQTYWEQANATLHPKIVALLRGDYEQLPNLKVGEEAVQIDLIPIIAQMLRDLTEQGIEGLDLKLTIPELPTDPRTAVETLARTLGHPLPDGFGQVTIMTSAELESYQSTAGALRAAAWILLALTIVLIALAIVLAHDRRRAIAWLGVGTALTMVLGTVILRNVKESILASIDSDQAQAVAREVTASLGGSLRGVATVIAWIGVAVAVIAYVAGRPAWLMALIGWIRSAGTDRPGGGFQGWLGPRADAARFVVLAIGALALFLAGITLVSALVVGVVVALALWWIGVAQHRFGVAT